MVRSGYTYNSPVSDQVVPDIFHAVEQAIDQAIARGYKNVILAIHDETDERVGRRWLSASSTQQAIRSDGRIIILRGSLEEVVHGILRESKDNSSIAVVGHGQMFVNLEEAGKNIPRDLGFISFDSSSYDDSITSIIQPYAECGRRAISHLSALVETGSLGLPEVPARITLQCKWREGSTILPSVE